VYVVFRVGVSVRARVFENCVMCTCLRADAQSPDVTDLHFSEGNAADTQALLIV
jgi:hypothetical protein